MKEASKRTPRSPASGSAEDLEAVAKLGKEVTIKGTKEKRRAEREAKSEAAKVASEDVVLSERGFNEVLDKFARREPKPVLKVGSKNDQKTDRRPKMTDAEQSAEFKRVAREHGAEGDEEAFKGVLRKLAKARNS